MTIARAFVANRGELAVRIDRSTWTPAPICGLVGLLGDVALPELERTLNMGAGMVAVLDPSAADAAIAALTDLRGKKASG